uniref:Uncharacterized protein n=1 Tax=Rhizophora mucronata TaxID=61149 RepID=A0A2P2PV76_RHIMU
MRMEYQWTSQTTLTNCNDNNHFRQITCKLNRPTELLDLLLANTNQVPMN